MSTNQRRKQAGIKSNGRRRMGRGLGLEGFVVEGWNWANKVLLLVPIPSGQNFIHFFFSPLVLCFGALCSLCSPHLMTNLLLFLSLLTLAPLATAGVQEDLLREIRALRAELAAASGAAAAATPQQPSSPQLDLLALREADRWGFSYCNGLAHLLPRYTLLRAHSSASLWDSSGQFDWGLWVLFPEALFLRRIWQVSGSTPLITVGYCLTFLASGLAGLLNTLLVLAAAGLVLTPSVNLRAFSLGVLLLELLVMPLCLALLWHAYMYLLWPLLPQALTGIGLWVEMAWALVYCLSSLYR